MSNGFITVSFTPPANDGGTPITEYYAMAFQNGVATGVFATGTSSPIVISGLTNGVTYTAEVYAINLVGSGSYSVASNPVTPSTVPSAPTGLVANAGDSLATVSFVPGNTGGNPVTEFTATASTGQQVTGPASPLVVTGLVNGVAVTFTVVAINGNGDSPPSAPSNSVIPLPTVTPPYPPTGLTATAGILSASVAFTPPLNNGGGAITDYVITSTPPGSSASGTSSPIVVSNLTAGVSYTFTGVAVNSAGPSVASAPSNAVTPLASITVPTQPLNPSAVAGNAQAIVSFSPPTSNGGSPITGYQVNTLISGSIVGSPTNGTSIPITVTGLTNGQPYTFDVQAINAAGTGPASVQTGVVTPTASPVVPTPPLNLVATAGVTQASVAFSPPTSNGGSPITGYTVTSSSGPSQTGTNSPIVVTGLAGGTAVNFTAVATNAVGNSPASVASNTVTPRLALTISSPVSGSTWPAATQGVSYSLTATAANDAAPDVWSASGLPTGMSIAASGTHTAAVTGTPSVNGNFSPSVTVKDASGQSYTGNYTLTVANVTGAPATPYEIRLHSQGCLPTDWNVNQPLQAGAPYTISHPSYTNIQVPFDASPGATSFNIRRSTDQTNWTVLSNAGWSGRVYSDTTAGCSVNAVIGGGGSCPSSTTVNFPANTYYYQVQAVNASGVSGWSPTQSIYLYLGNADGAYGANRYLLWDDASLNSAGTSTVNNDTTQGYSAYSAYGDAYDCLVTQNGYWLPAIWGPFVRWLGWGGAITGANASGGSAAGGYFNFDFKPVSSGAQVGLSWHCVAVQGGGDENLLNGLFIGPGSPYIKRGTMAVGQWCSISIPLNALNVLKVNGVPGGVVQPALYKVTIQGGGGGTNQFAVGRTRYSPTIGP